MNPLPLTLVFNSYVALLTPLVMYFTIFKKYASSVKSIVPYFIKEFIFVILVGWITSSWLSMYATLEQCGNINILWTLLIGLITPAFLLTGLILVRYLLPVLKNPAKVLFGWIKNEIIQDSLITGFYMMLFSWIGSIITYFLAIDDGCRLTRDNMNKFRADMKKRQEEAELKNELEDDDEETSEEPKLVTI